MSTLLGYARVSTHDQNAESQEDALRAAGCSRVFTDFASGKRDSRPGLEQAFDHLRPGDVLVITGLDRLGRSLPHLLTLMTQLQDRDVQLRSLREGIFTDSPGGELIYRVFAAVADFEHRLMLERTHAGLAAAAARGRKGGRRPKVTPDLLKSARALLADTERNLTVGQVAKQLGVGTSTLYRHLAESESAEG